MLEIFPARTFSQTRNLQLWGKCDTAMEL